MLEAKEKHTSVCSRPAAFSGKMCDQEGHHSDLPNSGHHPRVSLPGNHVRRKAHEEGPYKGADLLGGTLASPLLFLQAAFPHTAQGREEKVTHRVAWPGHRKVILMNKEQLLSLGTWL